MKWFYKENEHLYLFVTCLLSLSLQVLGKVKRNRLAERRNIMTANQINYAGLRETQRHNRATLEETKLHNRTTERQQDRSLAIGERQAVVAELNAATSARDVDEKSRHNVEQERINWWSAQGQLAESQTHNREMERIQGAQADAALQQAANAAKKIQSEREIATMQLYQTARDVTSRERQAAVSERQASVSEKDAISRRMQAEAAQMSAIAASIQANSSQTSAAAAYQSALAAMANAATRQSELSELMRYHDVTSGETQRHNEVSEAAQRLGVYATLEQARAATSQARSREAEVEVAKKNATSNRINAISNAVNAVTKSASTIGGLAKSIIMGG